MNRFKIKSKENIYDIFIYKGSYAPYNQNNIIYGLYVILENLIIDELRVYEIDNIKIKEISKKEYINFIQIIDCVYTE